ncbi:MAG: hypothetical protein QOJ95_3352, partial [Mycobacterium sp.]|nr:hypothetical protein [Mycobacterium sp.]
MPRVDYPTGKATVDEVGRWVTLITVARNEGPTGPPDDPYYSNNEPTQYGPRSEPQAYSEPTMAANYGGYDQYGQQPDYGQPPPPPEPP